MPSRKKSGRATAEAAYTALLKDNTTLVGDVGEAWDALEATLNDAVSQRERYEEARSAAVKAAAVTSDQLDQMGYRRTPKIPTLPARVVEEPRGGAESNGAGTHEENGSGAAPAPLASVSANGGQEHS